jgi:hypothetical protein
MLLSKLSTSVVTLVSPVCLALSTRILSGGTIVAFDQDAEQLEVIRNGSLLIENGLITAVYNTTLIDIPDNTEVIDCTNQIITPGFIDTRKHKRPPPPSLLAVFFPVRKTNRCLTCARPPRMADRFQNDGF